LNALDLMQCGSRLLAIQLRGSGAGQSPLRAVHNRHRHLQIAQQFGARSFLLRLPLRFQKQLGIIQNAFADRGRTFVPRAIQLAGFPRVAVILSEDGSHPLAIFQADAHRRHQKLHRHLRCNLAFTNLTLDRFRQRFHKSQPSRYPAHAPVEPPRQLIEAIAEPLLQLSQEPSHLQCGFLFRQAQGTVQHDGLSFVHRPHHDFHFVPAKLLERPDALVAVDHHITVYLAIGRRHHHDGNLLATFCQRCQ
jgi:hypothetical protein